MNKLVATVEFNVDDKVQKYGVEYLETRQTKQRFQGKSREKFQTLSWQRNSSAEMPYVTVLRTIIFRKLLV